MTPVEILSDRLENLAALRLRLVVVFAQYNAYQRETGGMGTNLPINQRITDLVQRLKRYDAL